MKQLGIPNPRESLENPESVPVWDIETLTPSRKSEYMKIMLLSKVEVIFCDLSPSLLLLLGL